MDSFEVPTIPKIFVPQIPIFRHESQSDSNTCRTNPKQLAKESPIAGKESSSSIDSEAKAAANGTDATLTAPPKLCASCSQILLSYLAPLQRYVNEVVQIARGGNDVTTSPLFDLINAEVLQSKNDIPNSDQTSTDKYGDNHSENNRETNAYRRDHHFDSGPQSKEQPVGGHEQRRDLTHVSNDNIGQSFDKNEKPMNEYQSHYQRPTESGGQSQALTTGGHAQEHKIQNQKQVPNHDHNEGYVEHQVHEGSTPVIPTDRENDSQYREDNQTKSSGQYENEDKSGYQDQRKAFHEEKAEMHSRNVPRMPAHHISEHTQPSRQLAGVEEQRTSGNTSWADHEASEEYGVSVRSPYAFVTIAYNNLSATNAIILANSLLLTNNKTMSYEDQNGENVTIQIPFIILIGGNIDPVLKEAIYMVFDEVISQPMDVKLALLSDQSFGIRQNKLQLWKELQNYNKCLFLESSTLVVAKVTHLFEECQELSASVDWLFPDNFNCSVFIFEPSLTTYEQIISFALFHQKCSAQRDEGGAEALDEMTLLNQFFAAKWNRISFVYNFVKNDAIYSQIPAFMKYGDSIKIVNFGHMMSQSGGLSAQPSSTSVQPWHLMFDLLAAGQQDVIKSMPIDNFSKFYLNCFIQRLWPIIQNPLTPLLVTKYGIGRREWSIFDLIRLLTNESGIETDDHMFTQTPITFRRIKSTAEKLAKYESLADEEDQDLPEDFQKLSVDTEIKASDDALENEEGDDQLETEAQPGQSQAPQEQRELQLTEQQLDERSKREWEAGRIDWMGAHQSDKIISRLKKLIKND